MAATDYYPAPTGNQTSGLYEFLNYITGVSGSLFFAVILLVVWIIAFLGMKQYSTSKAWFFASFFCSILAIPLAILNLLAPIWMYMCIFLAAIGLVWIKLDVQS